MYVQYTSSINLWQESNKETEDKSKKKQLNDFHYLLILFEFGGSKILRSPIHKDDFLRVEVRQYCSYFFSSAEANALDSVVAKGTLS